MLISIDSNWIFLKHLNRETALLLGTLIAISDQDADIDGWFRYVAFDVFELCSIDEATQSRAITKLKNKRIVSSCVDNRKRYLKIEREALATLSDPIPAPPLTAEDVLGILGHDDESDE